VWGIKMYPFFGKSMDMTTRVSTLKYPPNDLENFIPKGWRKGKNRTELTHLKTNTRWKHG
jgi:hypothetical protein